MSLVLLIIGVLLFIGLVVIHEWGHFIAARRSGVKVEEFGIFFPPRLFKHKTKDGWLFTINLLPLGGFVRLKGEHDTDTVKGSFGAASLWNKTKIMAAGVVMNLIVAVILFAILAVVGMPQLVENQFTVKSDTKISQSKLFIGYVEPHSPAGDAGLKSGDQLRGAWTSQVGCDIPVTTAKSGQLCTTENLPAPNVKLDTEQDLKQFTKQHADDVVQLSISRETRQYVVTTHLRSQEEVAASLKTDNPKGYLGVAPSAYKLQRSTWSAPVVAVGLTGQFTALTFQGLGHALAGVGSIIAGAFTGNTEARQHGQTASSQQVSGPVGVFEILKSGSLLGPELVLFIIAIISLTLAIMNILPIPALDGGRLWITLFTRSIGKPLSAKREEMINASGMLFLIGLMILITVVDVRRFF
jgi:regulator of sigma E protease